MPYPVELAILQSSNTPRQAKGRQIICNIYKVQLRTSKSTQKHMAQC